MRPIRVRVITLNDDAALIDYAKPIVNELRANMVRLGSDFQRAAVQGKDFQRGTLRKFPASSRRRLRFVIGGRDLEAGAVSSHLRKWKLV